MIPAEKVKDYIMHPEAVVRSFAVNYFAEGNFTETEKRRIMSLILESCEKYGHQERTNRRVLSYANQLPQTEETVSVILSRLKEKRIINLWYESILVQAAPQVVKPFLSELDAIVSPHSMKTIGQRLEIASRDTGSLWEELLSFGDEARGKFVSEFDHNYGKYLAWELAARADLSSQTILDQAQSYDVTKYRGYSNIYLMIILGERRLEASIPYLIDTLRSDS